MIQHSAAKPCLACGRSIKGRSDKKFCDDSCRNTYNNQLKSGDNNYVRSINNSLRRNRRILEALLPKEEKMIKITRDALLQQGFQFKYCTHSYTNARGNVYLFCYDYGYLQLEKGWCLVVKRKEE
jgi:Uncharacterized protein containing a Zn-ribbon (DUF2116)